MHIGFGFGIRNVEGEMILEIADALNFVVANTWFKKNEGRLITYETDKCRTVIRYIIIRRVRELIIVINCNCRYFQRASARQGSIDDGEAC